ncbi:olfactory protein-like [Pleurodeles waltl]|uniref:olfactory protein-like n=1 Tax=Pleurodeles waltl TaxID=8319 RepID=UPI003709C5D2
MSVMWISLGLLFSGLLQVQAMEIPVMANFDTEKFLGQWYAVAVASDCPQFLQMKSMMKMPITIFSLLDDGDLYAATGVPGPSGCMKMDMVYHTVKPGRYTQSVPEKSDIRFVEGDSDVSLLEYSQSVSESGDACKMVRLFARKPEIPAEAVPHFKMLIAAVGLAIGDATQLPRDMDCVPGEF